MAHIGCDRPPTSSQESDRPGRVVDRNDSTTPSSVRRKSRLARRRADRVCARATATAAKCRTHLRQNPPPAAQGHLLRVPRQKKEPFLGCHIEGHKLRRLIPVEISLQSRSGSAREPFIHCQVIQVTHRMPSYVIKARSGVCDKNPESTSSSTEYLVKIIGIRGVHPAEHDGHVSVRRDTEAVDPFIFAFPGQRDRHTAQIRRQPVPCDFTAKPAIEICQLSESDLVSVRKADVEIVVPCTD